MAVGMTAEGFDGRREAQWARGRNEAEIRGRVTTRAPDPEASNDCEAEKVFWVPLAAR